MPSTFWTRMRHVLQITAMLASNKKGEGQLSDMLHRNSWKRQALATWISAMPHLQLTWIRGVSASCLSVRVTGSHVIFGTAFTAYRTSSRALNGRTLLVPTNPARNHRLLIQEYREFITWVMNFTVKRLWLHIKNTYLIFIEFLSVVSEPVASDINSNYVSVTC